jgi:hypothetical protein
MVAVFVGDKDYIGVFQTILRYPRKGFTLGVFFQIGVDKEFILPDTQEPACVAKPAYAVRIIISHIRPL